jgi:hypothetical protein
MSFLVDLTRIVNFGFFKISVLSYIMEPILSHKVLTHHLSEEHIVA